jgi:hypothetical protein
MQSIWLFSLLVFGCAASKEVTDIHGNKQKVITCSNLGYCHEKARDLCGNYQTIDTKTVPGPFNSEEISLSVKCTP